MLLRGKSQWNRALRLMVIVALVGFEVALVIPAVVLAFLRALLREVQTGADAITVYVEKLEIEARNMER